MAPHARGASDPWRLRPVAPHNRGASNASHLILGKKIRKSVRLCEALLVLEAYDTTATDLRKILQPFRIFLHLCMFLCILIQIFLQGHIYCTLCYCLNEYRCKVVHLWKYMGIHSVILTTLQNTPTFFLFVYFRYIYIFYII
jgi:hypothetical protein